MDISPVLGVWPRISLPVSLTNNQNFKNGALTPISYVLGVWLRISLPVSLTKNQNNKKTELQPQFSSCKEYDRESVYLSA